MSATFPLLPLGSWTCESCLRETQYHITNVEAKHARLFQEPGPIPARHCHIASDITASSKIHSTFLSTQLLLHNEEHGRPVKSMSTRPLPHFFGYEMCCLVRNNAMWYTMVVAEAFCKSTGGSFAETLYREKVNPYPEQVSMPVRTKHCPIHGGSGPTQSAHHQITERSPLDLSVSGLAVGLCCWIWAVDSDYSHVTKFIRNLHPCHHGHFVHGPM